MPQVVGCHVDPTNNDMEVVMIRGSVVNEGSARIAPPAPYGTIDEDTIALGHENGNARFIAESQKP